MVLLIAGCKAPAPPNVVVPEACAAWSSTVVTVEQSAGALIADQGFDQVVGLGDFDGDGADDLATLDAGVLRVFSGLSLTTGATLRPSDALLTVDLGATGLAPAGDLDGDGLMDVVAGDETRWWVFTVASGQGRLRSEDAFASISASGGGRLVAVAGGGDVNGDGLDDLIVSQYFAQDGRDKEEVTRLVTLAQGGDLSVSDGTTGFGAVVDALRPHTLVILGDLDQDGADDVAAGAARNFAAVHWSSAWQDGPFGGLSEKEVHLHDCWPQGDGCRAWVEVGAPGDVDGDGWPDLIAVGHDTASAWLIPGFDLTTNKYNTQAFGGKRADLRQIKGARALIALGDVDGQLTDEGRPLADLLATDDDATAWLIKGNQLSNQTAIQLSEAVHRFEGFAPNGGILGVGSGDLDGDGFDDLLVGDSDTLHALLSPGACSAR